MRTRPFREPVNPTESMSSSGGATESEVAWRGNLRAVGIAQLAAVLGWMISVPFVPIYLRDVGVVDDRSLALFTGLAGTAGGIGSMLGAPIWGAISDRRGRRVALISSMIAGGATLLLLGGAQGPWEIVLLRFANGSMSATVLTASALIASGTPRAKLSYAFGSLSMAIYAASTIGPLVGGLLTNAVGVRLAFEVGGVVFALSAILVLTSVHEPRSAESRAGGSGPSPAAETGPASVVESGPAAETHEMPARSEPVRPDVRRALVPVIVCVGLFAASSWLYQPFLVVRAVNEFGAASSLLTGAALGLMGLASTIGAVGSSRLAQSIGFRHLLSSAGVVLAVDLVLSAAVPGVLSVVCGAAIAGLMIGAATPALLALIALEAPAASRGSLIGIGMGIQAAGSAVGPVLGGVLAASAGVGAAIAGAGVIALAAAALVKVGVREPLH